MGLGGDDVYKICFRSHSLEKEITFRCIDVRFDVNLRQIRLLYAGCGQRIMDFEQLGTLPEQCRAFPWTHSLRSS
jgi:hypothetical protein